MLLYKHVSRIILSWLAICILILVVVASRSTHHGLMRTVIGAPGYEPSTQWPWPYFDGADYNYDDFLNGAHGVRFAGIVWLGEENQTTWRVIHSHDVTVRINGDVVYQVRGSMPITTRDIPITTGEQWLKIEIEYPHGPRPMLGENRDELGIYERTVWGSWRLLPKWRLYPESPTAEFVAQERLLYNLTRMAWIGFFVGLLAWLLAWIWYKRLWTHRPAWAIAAIILLAFLLRLIVLADRAQHDQFFYYLAPGSDNYVLNARQLLSGQISLAGIFGNPGDIAWHALWISFLGPHLGNLYLLNTAICVISVGMIAGAGWLALGERIGLLAGLIAACYPPLISYHTTLDISSLLAWLCAGMLLAAMWLARRRTLRSAAIFGVLVGLAGLARATTLVSILAAVFAFTVARDRWGPLHSWRTTVTVSIISVLFVLLTVSPQTLANRLAGETALVSSNGPIILYHGNNRDASGIVEFFRPAYRLAVMRGDNLVNATLTDIHTDPVRALSLVCHKLGGFWRNAEFGAYDPSIADASFYPSPVLQVLSLRGWVGFSLLAWLGLTGIFVLLADPTTRGQRISLFLGMLILANTAVIVLLLLEARYRIPILPPLILCAAIAIDRCITSIQNRHPNSGLLASGGVALAFLFAMHILDISLPTKSFLRGDLPGTAIPHVSDFGGRIDLVGFAPYDTNYRPGGYFYTTIYWRLLTPALNDLSVSVQLLDANGDRVAWADATLGSVSYPEVGTSKWPLGAMLAEGYLIELPKDLPPVMDIYLNLYDPDTGDRLPVIAADGTSSKEDRIHLGRLGVLTAEGVPGLDDPVTEADYWLGDSLHITGHSLPRTLSLSDNLSVGVRIEAIRPIYEDYILFFHFLDETGRPVTQSDSPILNGDWTTAALIPGHPVGAIRSIDLPDDLLPGKYRLIMGMYTYPSLERLPVRDAQNNQLVDNLIEVGWVEVRQPDN